VNEEHFERKNEMKDAETGQFQQNMQEPRVQQPLEHQLQVGVAKKQEEDLTEKQQYRPAQRVTKEETGSDGTRQGGIADNLLLHLRQAPQQLQEPHRQQPPSDKDLTRRQHQSAPGEEKSFAQQTGVGVDNAPQRDAAENRLLRKLGRKEVSSTARSAVKLSQHPDCARDVHRHCKGSNLQNFAVVDCLQDNLEVSI